eukprot:649707-Hanusia_phi.AAC.1
MAKAGESNRSLLTSSTTNGGQRGKFGLDKDGWASSSHRRHPLSPPSVRAAPPGVQACRGTRLH